MAAAATSIAGDLRELTPGHWRDVMGASLDGTWVTDRTTLPALREEGGGCFVTFGSILGRHAVAGYGAYAAAKGRHRGAHQGLGSRERRPRRTGALRGARILDTPMMWQDVPPQDVASMRAGCAEEIPCGRLGMPEEIARLVRFLISDACPFLNGTTIVVDGGVLVRSPPGTDPG